MAQTNMPDAVRAVLKIAGALLETVNEAGPNGAPAGPMYAAFMAHGGTLAQFESVMAGLVRAGRITKCGNVYYPVAGCAPPPQY